MVKLTEVLLERLSQQINNSSGPLPFIKFMLDSFIEIVADNADRDNIVKGALKAFIMK